MIQRKNRVRQAGIQIYPTLTEVEVYLPHKCINNMKRFQIKLGKREETREIVQKMIILLLPSVYKPKKLAEDNHAMALFQVSMNIQPETAGFLQ